MRLFTAVTLNDSVKDRLCDAIDALRAKSVRGNFTRRENLHLTLVFIGETAKNEEIRGAMDTLAVPAFTLTIGGIGRFKREGGDLYWAGVQQSEPLNAAYETLTASLRQMGFSMESRGYRPHLTLGRTVVFPSGFDITGLSGILPETPVPVAKISLMKSERNAGKLTYTEIYAKRL
jgi:2'-5' RNA ligase